MDNEIKGEGNSLNYTYRMHDPRVGRFFSVDPLARSYTHYSPYSFAGNKVINSIEFEGLEDLVILLDAATNLPHIRDNVGQDIVQDVISSTSEKVGKELVLKSYKIAEAKLADGKLVTNTGETVQTTRMKTEEMTAELIDGTEVKKITRGVNFGYKKNGKIVTTKGLNQLEAFSNKGWAKATGKVLSELAGSVMVLWDVANAMEQDGELSPLTLTPLEPFASILKADKDEQWAIIVESIFDDFEKEKAKGLDKTIDFVNEWNHNVLKDYHIMMVSESTISKIIKGEINTIDQLLDSDSMEEHNNNAILINRVNNDQHVIETFFVKEKDK